MFTFEFFLLLWLTVGGVSSLVWVAAVYTLDSGFHKARDGLGPATWTDVVIAIGGTLLFPIMWLATWNMVRERRAYGAVV